MIKLQKETEAAILAWIRSQDGNHRTDRNTTIGGSYAEWEAK